MPIVWQKLPEVKVTLLGNDPPEEVEQFANDYRVRVPVSIPNVR